MHCHTIESWCQIQWWETSVLIQQTINVRHVIGILHIWWLRWHKHVKRASSCITYVSHLTVIVLCQKKTWSDCLKKDIVECNLSNFNPMDRDIYKKAVRLSQVLYTPDSGQQQHHRYRNRILWLWWWWRWWWIYDKLTRGRHLRLLATAPEGH